MTIPPEMLDLSRRLLAHEAVAGNRSEPAESAAVLVYEKLRYLLCVLVGVTGCRLLASRALALARTKAPNLSAVQVTADGSAQGLGEPGSRIDDSLDTPGEVIFIAQLLALLNTFIGGALTLRLVQDTWPDVPMIAISETGRGSEKDEHTR